MKALGQTPSVTVCIPTFNRAGFLTSAIESVLGQTYTDFELFVLDDCSTDDTATAVSSFTDSRLRYQRNSSNLGMAGNWNLGFEVANTRYVALLHDDDMWTPGFLEKCMEVVRSEPDIGFVHSATLQIDSLGEVVGGPKLALPGHDKVFSSSEAISRFVRRMEVAPSAALVSREAFFESGGFRTDWPFSMDWQLWLKIAARRGVAFLAEPLVYVRSHVDQLTAHFQGKPLAIALDRFGMLNQTIAELPLLRTQRDELLRDSMKSLAQTQLVEAWDMSTRGAKGDAWREANFAFHIDTLIAAHAPLLTLATYLSLLLPPFLLARVNRSRRQIRPFFRRD